MSKSIVPRIDPEIVRARADRLYRGDSEKVATTSLKIADRHGVGISSRYQKADEFETMMRMVDAVDAELVGLIDNIWCDSKANACYSVVLNQCTQRQADQIGYQLQAASGGHNGIFIDGEKGVGLVLDPWWPGEPDEFEDSEEQT